MQIWDAVLSFVNSNAPLWSFLVTIATIVYVVLTHKMLKESEKVRKLQNRPYVIADLTLDGVWLKMTVKNVGNDSASKVQIAVDEIQNNPLSNIDFLAPGRELINTVKYAFGETEKQESPEYHFHISYSDASNEMYNSQYKIDISPLLNSRDFVSSANKEIVDKLDKAVDSLKDINKTIDHLTDAAKSQADYTKDIEKHLDKIASR